MDEFETPVFIYAPQQVICGTFWHWTTTIILLRMQLTTIYTKQQVNKDLYLLINYLPEAKTAVISE